MAIADKFFALLAREEYKKGRLTDTWILTLKEHFLRLAERREVVEPSIVKFPMTATSYFATSTSVKASAGKVYGIRVRSASGATLPGPADTNTGTANVAVDILDGAVIRARVWCKATQSAEAVYLTEDNGIECGTSINVIANNATDGTTDLATVNSIEIEVVFS